MYTCRYVHVSLHTENQYKRATSLAASAVKKNATCLFTNPYHCPKSRKWPKSQCKEEEMGLVRNTAGGDRVLFLTKNLAAKSKLPSKLFSCICCLYNVLHKRRKALKNPSGMMAENVTLEERTAGKTQKNLTIIRGVCLLQLLFRRSCDDRQWQNLRDKRKKWVPQWFSR